MRRTSLQLASLASAFSALALLGCNSSDVECPKEGHGDWAFRLSFDESEDGSCPYEGTLEREGKIQEMDCGPTEGGACACTGGNEYGTYAITLTNTETNEVEHAVIEVVRAGSPICVDYDVIESFEIGAGGAGGAGGQGGAMN